MISMCGVHVSLTEHVTSGVFQFQSWRIIYPDWLGIKLTPSLSQEWVIKAAALALIRRFTVGVVIMAAGEETNKRSFTADTSGKKKPHRFPHFYPRASGCIFMGLSPSIMLTAWKYVCEFLSINAWRVSHFMVKSHDCSLNLLKPEKERVCVSWWNGYKTISRTFKYIKSTFHQSPSTLVGK